MKKVEKYTKTARIKNDSDDEITALAISLNLSNKIHQLPRATSIRRLRLYRLLSTRTIIKRR